MAANHRTDDDLCEAALSYLEKGLCVLPCLLKKKHPDFSWKEFEKRLPTRDEIKRWFASNGYRALSVVCGQISGGVELLDFDAQGEFYQPWRDLVEAEAPGLLNKLVIETSQSKGFHIVYRSSHIKIPPNQKLASIGVEVGGPGNHPYKKGKPLKAFEHNGNGKWFINPCLIETRGEGGLFLCSPSKGYDLIQNDFSKIPTITATERDVLISAARALNQWLAPANVIDQPRPAADKGRKGLKPGEDFNSRGNVHEILEKHGWKKTGRTGNVQGGSLAEHYLRPGKNKGQSASLIDKKTFYVFTSNGTPFDNDKAYSPFAVYALLEHSGNYSEAAKALAKKGYGEQKVTSQDVAPGWVQDALLGVKEGKRDQTCTKLVGYYLTLFKGDRQQTRDILYSWNERNEPPLEKTEIDRIVTGVTTPKQSSPIKTLNTTDLGNAERLIKRHGHDLRYCHPWGKWYVFDGQRWAPDDTAEIKRRAKETVRSIYAEAAKASNEDRAKSLAKHAIGSEADAKIKALLSCAQSEEGIPVLPNQLDQNTWLLNCKNGTLNLKTGELLPHRRGDLITKICPVDYDPDVKCHRWDLFLDRITDGNKDLILFLQKAIGYCLTGDVSEQCFFNLFGAGQNGKTTFIETIASLLSDYAQRTPVQTFLQKRNETIPSDIAKLKGSRFVSSVEPEAGQSMAESLIKQLTGGDTVSARFLHKEWFEYQVTYKIFIATNHRIKIRGVDHAMWRRVREIPFNVKIPDHEQDKHLVDKLKAELPGILAWAVRGCLLWQKEGLGVPQVVRQATQDYRREMDGLIGFLDERCFRNDDPRVQVSKKDLYDAYYEWSIEAGESYLGKRNFGAALRERGVKEGKSGQNKGHCWFGIGLLIDERGPNVTLSTSGDKKSPQNSNDISHIGKVTNG